MEIVAALFVEGIDFRQVAGPSTRIDITGAFFSTAVERTRRSSSPHLVVLVRAPAGTDGNATLETVFVGDGDEEVGRNRQSFFVEPGKFGYRLVKGELEFPEPGTDRGPLHDRRERLVGHASRSRAAARLTPDDRAQPGPVAAPKPRRHGSRESLRGRALAAPDSRRGGRARSRARSSSDSTASAPISSSASRRRTTSARSKTSPAGCASCSNPTSSSGCTAVGGRGRQRSRSRTARACRCSRRASARAGSTASRSTRSRPTTGSRSRVGPTSCPARGTLLMLADPFSFPVADFLAAVQRAGARAHGDRRMRVGRRPARRRTASCSTTASSRAARSRCMCSDDVPVRAVVSQGCRPIGKPLTITRAERNLVHELAGQPAMARLQEIVHSATEADRELMREGLHLGLVVDEHRLDFERGDFLVRNLLGADQSTGSLAVGELGRRRPDRAVPGPRRRGGRRRPALPARAASPATAALMFTCNGRGHAPVRRTRSRRRRRSRSCSDRCRWPARSARARSARSAAATSCTASPPASPSSADTVSGARRLPRPAVRGRESTVVGCDGPRKGVDDGRRARSSAASTSIRGARDGRGAEGELGSPGHADGARAARRRAVDAHHEVRRVRRPTGPTATASCCRPGTRRCCCTRCCTSPASGSSSTTSASSASGARARPATPSTATRRASRSRPVRSARASANAVGIAIAEKHLRARFGADVCDHHVFGICSDGDLMEGISHEAASLAGHLQLGRLVFVYDDNHITIDGDDRARVQRRRARSASRRTAGTSCSSARPPKTSTRSKPGCARAWPRSDRPTLVVLRSHIGYPSPKVQDTAAAHGNPLGADEVARVKEILGLPPEDFFVPDDVLALLPRSRPARRDARRRGRSATRGSRANPDAPTSTRRASPGARSAVGSRSCPTLRRATQIATRDAIKDVLSAVADVVPGLSSGSGDLTGNTGMAVKSLGVMHARRRERPASSTTASASTAWARPRTAWRCRACCPRVGTFFVFSDYMRPAVRLAAIMQTKVALRLDARLRRRRRGRPDPPAGRAARVVARDARAARDPARRRQRGRGRVARAPRRRRARPR